MILRKFLRLPATMAATGLSRSSIYQLVQSGTFPKPVKIGPKAVAWVEDEVAQYNEAKIAARDLVPLLGDAAADFELVDATRNAAGNPETTYRRKVAPQ